MKVKDLVSNSVWIPGDDYDSCNIPKISILLPTFRRGKSGLFRRAVESILSQTLQEIELIIIDDASTDGTAEQIAEFCARDGRVSVIRHLKNIGLPAVSEYEGYLKARAPLLSFAFDDTMFERDALEQLYGESLKAPHAMIYGHVELSWRDSKTGQVASIKLGSNRSQGLLRISNAIPNNGVLLPRSIIEDVGLYDPHVVIARLCDWDLWCRVAERYEIKFVDISIGREDGLITNDSLGNTYYVDSWAVNEWMRTSRNEKLQPKNFGDYDVLMPCLDQGLCTRTIIESMARRHAEMRGWPFSKQPALTDQSEGYILVVNLQHDASTSLCFDMLPPHIAKRLRIITYNSGFSVEEIARATCVIFVRAVNAFKPWIDAAKLLEIPAYFYLDDNLPLLEQSGELNIPNENYSPSSVRESMRLFAGVLLTSKNLISYFKENLLHDNLLYFPVSFFDQRPLSVDYYEEKRPGEITIVVAGGSHRNAGLWEVVVPALKKLAEEGVLIHLVGPLLDESDQYNLPDNLRITGFSFEIGYLFAMRRFARYKPDFVVHAPSNTKNALYKTLHPLVAAALMDTVAILPDSPPYDVLKSKGNAIVVGDSSKPLSWYSVIREILSGEHNLNVIKKKNQVYCAENFSGSENVEVLLSLLKRHGGEVSWFEQSRRLHKLMVYLRQLPTTHVEEINTGLMGKSALLLDQYRKMARYSWRHRLFSKGNNLWSQVSPCFHRLKQASEQNAWKKSGSSLELSDSLHDMPYREYRISPKEGRLVAVWLAFTVDSVKLGQIGVEIVSPKNTIEDLCLLDLAALNLNEPVRFALNGACVKKDEFWIIRVFAKSVTPVYVYEFLNRQMFGLHFTRPTPFMALDIE